MTDIIHIFYSGVGGQGGVVFPLIRQGMSESKHAIAFYGVEELAPAYISKCEELGIPYRYFKKEKGLSLKAQKEMASWMTELKPRAVLAHSPATLYSCRRLKRKLPDTKIVAVEHHPNVLKRRKEWILSAIAHYAADHVVFLSETYKQEVKKRIGPLFRESRAKIIPNGLELEQYIDVRSSGCGHGPELTIGMQGRMVEVKDFATLLRAFSCVSTTLVERANVHLEFAGDGEDRSALERLAAELQIEHRVRFLGMLSHDALITRMKDWDIFALSTLGETMSIALMEAMACGLPVITTDVSGVAEFVRGRGNGVLVPPRQPEAMAKALEDLISDQGRRADLAAQAARYADEYLSVKRSWASYFELIGTPLASGS
ncbi:MAG: glycosyltransferase involved in cell wall biosynthesis [Verrucomicrobiales bacterium]|jgi:glycosyltransferase involved in cell wall biosynthesis